MRLRCEYCGTEYDETLLTCPNCHAANKNVKKTAESGPRTLEELKVWFYNTHGLTSEKTHIYVGKDHKEPACFGMYRDEETGDFVVYKNKADGERAIRYQGVDEQYAVNELYQLIQRQALRNGVDLNGAKEPGAITDRNSAISRASGNVGGSGGGFNIGTIFSLVIVLIPVIIMLASMFFRQVKEVSINKNIAKIYTEYKEGRASAEDYYQELSLNNKVEYKEGEWVSKGTSFYLDDLKRTIFPREREIFGLYKNKETSFSNDQQLLNWLESFPQNKIFWKESNDYYKYETTLYDIYEKENGKSFYITPVIVEKTHDSRPRSSDSSDSDSGGGSSGGGSWDSGDWDSSWGFIDPSEGFYLI